MMSIGGEGGGVKYQLADDQCDKLSVDRCRHCRLSSTDNVQFITVSVYLCQTKLQTRCDNRPVVSQFS